MIDVDISGNRGDFSYQIAFRSESRVTGIFGRSGAGKSTLLDAVSGTLNPVKGHVEVNDNCYFSSSSKVNLSQQSRRVGHIFQDARLFPHLSVKRNLTYARWAGGRSENHISFEEVVDLLGLKTFLDRKPDTLSGGEKQRVAIGRALLSNPHILLMDEPLSGLDNQRKSDIMPYLEHMTDKYGLPVLFISHDLNEVAHLCNHLVLIDEGRVLKSGKTESVLPFIEGRFNEGHYAPSALIKAAFDCYDENYPMTWLKVGTQKLLIPDVLPEKSRHYRLRIEAHNVALGLSKPEGLTIQNSLQAKVSDFYSDDSPYVDVGLHLEGQSIMARITRKSADELNLQKGQDIYCLIKSVAVQTL